MVNEAKQKLPRRYEKMRDSGVAWIGMVPENATIVRLKHLTAYIESGTSVNAGQSPAQNSAFGILKTSCVSKFVFSPGENKSVNLDEYNRVHCPVCHNTIIVSRMNTPDLVGACGYVDRDYLNLFLPDRLWQVHFKTSVNVKYLWYYLQSCAVRQYYASLATGTSSSMQNISQQQFLNVPVVLFPDTFAFQIVAFLDNKCQQIDALIAEAKASIEEYKAWKASIIYEAVTKGLDPQAEMKDSGVEWIGEIPEEWYVCKTLFVLQMPITDGPHTTPELYAAGVPFVSAEAVSCGNGRIDFNHIRGYISEGFYQECCKKYIPQKDDIYMIKSGATTGKVAIVDVDTKFTIWSPLAAFRVNPKKVLPRYLFYFLQSPAYQKQVELGWSFGTQQNIGMRTLEKLKICVPPLSVQQEIIRYLDEKSKKLDAIIKEKTDLISDLESYKKSLIYEVVTGKRKVC